MGVAAAKAPARTKPSLGDALDHAKLIRDAAAATLEGAAAAHARAQQQKANAHTRLARHGNLDERVARSRAEMIKRDRHGPLPEGLLNELEQRTEAQEKVCESAGALQVLEAEHADAEKALRVARE